MRRFLGSVVTVLLLLAVLVPTVSASASWCESDPLVTIITPGGSPVDVHVTSYGLGAEHQAAVDSAAISYSVRSTEGGRATKVTISVLIPGDQYDDKFKVRTVVSTEANAAGTILGTANGKSGRAMTVEFKLDVP